MKREKQGVKINDWEEMKKIKSHVAEISQSWMFIYSLERNDSVIIMWSSIESDNHIYRLLCLILICWFER